MGLLRVRAPVVDVGVGEPGGPHHDAPEALRGPVLGDELGQLAGGGVVRLAAGGAVGREGGGRDADAAGGGGGARVFGLLGRRSLCVTRVSPVQHGNEMGGGEGGRWGDGAGRMVACTKTYNSSASADGVELVKVTHSSSVETKSWSAVEVQRSNGAT